MPSTGRATGSASPANPGEPASFDEALAIIVQAYPHRDTILKGTGASGSGAQGGGARVLAGRHVTRAQFLALSPAGQAAVARDAAAGKAVDYGLNFTNSVHRMTLHYG